jgi:1,3-propanediol dehydrogenase
VLRELWVQVADLERLAVGALLDACMSTNPRDASREQMVALFRAAL